MKIDKDILCFKVLNNIHSKEPLKEAGGLGLQNLRKRLELLYGNDFTFVAEAKYNLFETQITLPLHGN